MFLYLFVVLLISSSRGRGLDDYWDEDFDQNKECDHEDEVNHLLTLDQKPCESVGYVDGIVEKAFLYCKQKLVLNLQNYCELSVENPGDLIYCKTRNTVTCCYVNEKCVPFKDWGKNDFKMASSYLKDKRGYLESVRATGYKTCHSLDTSNDASKCAEDCEELRQLDFARNCSASGGLFKCCIRRDKFRCHECRFCCTLPMCTFPPGDMKDTVYDGIENQNAVNQKEKNQLLASDIFFSNVFYYVYDYRCIKPYSHPDPEKWHTWEVEGFRAASSEKMLENVQSFPYNKYMYNLADPKILEFASKNEKNARKFWKKGHGVNYVKRMPYINSTEGFPIFVNMLKCIKKCIKIENSKFAHSCRKKGGYLKCCNFAQSWGKLKNVRPNLIKEDFLKDKLSYPCQKPGRMNPCMWCSLDVTCTIRDMLTGEVSQMFYPKKNIRKATDIKKSEFDGPGFGLIFHWCFVLDICKFGTNATNMLLYNREEYLRATTKEELCSVHRYSFKTAANARITRVEKEKEDKKLCSKLRTNNIFLCSKEERKNILNPKLLEINDFIEKVISVAEKPKIKAGDKEDLQDYEELADKVAKLLSTKKQKRKLKLKTRHKEDAQDYKEPDEKVAKLLSTKKQKKKQKLKRKQKEKRKKRLKKKKKKKNKSKKSKRKKVKSESSSCGDVDLC